MDTVQLTQDCNAITKREFTFLYLFRGTPSTHLIDHERMKALVNQVIFELQSCRLRTWRPNHWTIAFLFKYVWPYITTRHKRFKIFIDIKF